MKIANEDEILKIAVRKQIIQEIQGPENRRRRLEAFKRYEILKDRIKKYILENLLMELDPATVKDMQSRISTINFYKKIVGKKARVYKTAPTRIAIEEKDQDVLEDIIELMKMNVRMKKTNKYLEAFLNCDVFVRPIFDSLSKKWFYRVDPLASYQYDVIEDAHDPERAMGYILSPFRHVVFSDEDPQNRERDGVAANFRDGDTKQQGIADSPADKPEEYVWWGTKYHLTFDESGKILHAKSGEKLLNPIQTLPIVSHARDRDGSFWAVGGEDIIDGSILVNTVLSDIYYIAKLHGTGLFYLFGKGVPKSYKVGPNRGITVNMEDGDPTPQIGFANANPQLKDHMELVEQYVAMLLTTNDLEPGSVQAKLSALTGGASGVQEMIMKSEPINAVEDDQEIFRDTEPQITRIGAKWHNLYLGKGLLRKDFAKIGKVNEDIDYSIKYGATQQFHSEKDKLEVIKIRKELGLDDQLRAFQLDNPDLSIEEAEKLYLEVLERRVKQSQDKLRITMMGVPNADNENEDELPPKSPKEDQEPNAEPEEES
jgi:hypothetical protein